MIRRLGRLFSVGLFVVSLQSTAWAGWLDDPSPDSSEATQSATNTSLVKVRFYLRDGSIDLSGYRFSDETASDFYGKKPRDLWPELMSQAKFDENIKKTNMRDVKIFINSENIVSLGDMYLPHESTGIGALRPKSYSEKDITKAMADKGLSDSISFTCQNENGPKHLKVFASRESVAAFAFEIKNSAELEFVGAGNSLSLRNQVATKGFAVPIKEKRNGKTVVVDTVYLGWDCVPANSNNKERGVK